MNRLVDRHDERVVGIIGAQPFEHVRQRLDDDARARMLGHESVQAVEAHAVVGADLHEFQPRRGPVQQDLQLALKTRNALDAVAGRRQQPVEQFSHAPDACSQVIKS
jgi:hypothetical protein